MKSIKKIKEGYIIFFIIVVTISSYVYMTVPKTYKRTFEGVLYRLGKENKDYCEKINITFDGHMKMDKWLEYRRFNGFAEISNYDGFIDNKQYIKRIKRWPEVNFVFDNKNSTLFNYHLFLKKDGRVSPKIVPIGYLYFDKDFKILSIAVHEDTGKTEVWNSTNGLMISAPAKDREEALEISNKLLLEWYEYKIDKLE